MRVLLATAALLLATGCSLDFSDSDGALQKNTCSSNSDCGPDGVCRSVDGAESMCVAKEAHLSGLKLVVTPAPGTSSLPGSSFLLDPSGSVQLTESSGGFAKEFSGSLPPLVSASFGVTYPPCNKVVDGKEMAVYQPADIVLASVPSAKGLPRSTYLAKSLVGGGDTSVGVFVPPGKYDVFVRPAAEGVDGCPLPPPILLEDQLIDRNTLLETGLEIPETLTGRIRDPLFTSLDGWKIDLVDASAGRPISDEAVLKQSGIHVYADFAVRLVWPDRLKPPVIRLRPPEGKAWPTVYWDLAAALGTSSELHVELDIHDLNVTPREVVTLFTKPDGAPVVASVTLQSQRLSGSSLASYSVALQTDAKGFLHTSLPPGKYRVRAIPIESDSLALADAELDVPEELDPKDPVCFCGHVIKIFPQNALLGEVETLSGEPLQQVPVVAVASSRTVPESFISLVLGMEAFTPRDSTSETDPQGAFRLGVDPGPVDFSVRPPSTSGYPWLARPRVVVQQTEKETDLVVPTNLGTIALPPPAVLYGDLFSQPGRSAASRLAGAQVSAWLPVDDPDGTGTAVQVAQTTADSNGHFILYLPSSISH